MFSVGIKISRLEIVIDNDKTIDDVIEESIAAAKKHDCIVTFIFRGTYIDVKKDSALGDVLWRFSEVRMKG